MVDKERTREPGMTRQERDEPHNDRRSGSNREFSSRDWEHANAPTDPERRRAFREKWAQTHLPNLPSKDGMHRCWVSTSHPTDTVERRLALGYRVLSLDDIKGADWSPQASSVKDAASADTAVRWREMIAMECPEEDYQAYMREFHHDQPMDMARDIYDPLLQTQDEIQDRGGRMAISDGFREMMRFRRAPRQFE